MVASLALNFWGTRSLVSCPGPKKIVYGGNTSCLQISDASDPTWFLIINAGFGINNLGETLFSSRPQNIHIFFSDFHWGHLQGLPFFLPLFFEQNHIHLYSPLEPNRLHQRLDILFNASYSPFEGLTHMPANISCHQIQGTTSVGPLEVASFGLGSSSSSTQGDSAVEADERFAYKVQGKGRAALSVALTFDPSLETPEKIKEFQDFSSESQLMILGATNFLGDPTPFSGRGCCSIDQAVGFAEKSRATTVLFSEHAPGRLDSDIEKEGKRIHQEHPDLKFAFAQEMQPYKV